MSRSQPKKNSAFTMIEVLVAMLVLSIGLLGMAAMTVVVIRSNTLSQQMSEATNIASSLMDRLKFQPASAFTNRCTTSITNPATCTPIAESGLFNTSATNTIFYPALTVDSANCGITGVIPNLGADGIVRNFDVVAANSVNIQGDIAAGTSVCGVSPPPQGQYLRYYKVSGANPSEATLAVVVLWVDKFQKWRHVKFSTTRSL